MKRDRKRNENILYEFKDSVNRYIAIVHVVSMVFFVPGFITCKTTFTLISELTLHQANLEINTVIHSVY